MRGWGFSFEGDSRGFMQQQGFEIVEMGKYGQHDGAALISDGDCAAENERDAHGKIR